MKSGVSCHERKGPFPAIFLLAGMAFFLFSLLFFAFFLCLPAACAEEKPAPSDKGQLWLRISVLSLTEEGVRALGEKDTLPPGSLQKLIDGKMARELETFHFPAQNGQDTMASIGHKFPLTYFDSKNSYYQIIFVDVGMKFAIKPVITSGGRIDVGMKSDISSIEDYRQEIERDTVFYYPSTKNSSAELSFSGLRNGETLIISNFHGLSLESFLKSLGEKEAFSRKGSGLVVAVTPSLAPSQGGPLGEEKGGPPSCIEMRSFFFPRALWKKYETRYRLSPGEMAGLTKSGGARLIDCQKILSSRSESAMFIGRKYPLTYFDPRSGMYQVIYIDIGMKGVVKCAALSPGRWDVTAKLWLNNADPSMLFGVRREQMPLKIYTISSDVILELSRGESGIITALRGEYFTKVIKDFLFPGIELSSDDELVIMVTVR
ncbi:MAG: hypothetical protein RDV48_29615 [Candidatus Eremiobacteraeota bacterium]|nr:hypothetical protein [Candidatus Eremiobacteraeota bacterium]